MSPDENDIVVPQYGLDVGNIFTWIYERVLVLFGQDPGGATDALLSIWQVFSIFAFGISALFLLGIIYVKLRSHELEEVIEHSLLEAEEAYQGQYGVRTSKNDRWEQAVKHAESESPNDWRLAIIEADIVLEEVLNRLGYGGITIGDKLKQASPQFFKTIEDAWKAHKVRNDIAHRGSDFVLTKRLARETIEQYRRVFEEHKVI